MKNPAARQIGVVPILAACTAGLLLTVATFVVAHRVERLAIERRFENHAADRAQDLDREFDACVEMLHSVRSLFDSSESVESDEFATFARNLLDHRGAITALEWAPRVPAARLEEHERRMRAAGSDGYTVTQPDAAGGLTPRIGVTGECFPTTYVAERRGRPRALGFDQAAVPARLAAIERTAATGSPVMTAPLELIGDESEAPAALVFLAVRAAPAWSSAFADSELRGVVMMALRYEDVVVRVIHGGAESASMAWRLIDRGDPAHEEVLRESSPWRDGDGVVRVPFDVAEREFAFDAAPSGAFLAASRGREPLLLAALTAVVSLGFVVGFYLHARAVARRASRGREAEVRRLSSVVEQTADAVMITDREGVIVYVNPAFATMTGFGVDEAVGRTPRILKSGVQGSRYYRRLWRTLLSDRTYRGTIVDRRKSGELFHAEHTITPIRDQSDGELFFVSVARDQTERRRREAQESEMRLAATIQDRLYPARAPRIAGLDVAGACFPARETCGDYFDFIRGADGSLAVVVGDICGHGLGPALLMAETRAYVRCLFRSERRIGRVIEELDVALMPDLADGCFVTLIAVELDRQRRRLSYVSAGHESGFVLDATGAVKSELSTTGPALGILPDLARDVSGPLSFEPGDTFVGLTDGVLEARDRGGRVFGSERTIDTVRRHLHASAEQVVRRLRSALDEFTAGMQREDDQTIVVCRATPVQTRKEWPALAHRPSVRAPGSGS